MPIEFTCSNGMEGVEVGDNVLLGFSPCSVRGWSSNYRAEHRVYWTLRLWAWLKNKFGLGLRQ